MQRAFEEGPIRKALEAAWSSETGCPMVRGQSCEWSMQRNGGGHSRPLWWRHTSNTLSGDMALLQSDRWQANRFDRQSVFTPRSTIRGT